MEEDKDANVPEEQQQQSMEVEESKEAAVNEDL